MYPKQPNSSSRLGDDSLLSSREVAEYFRISRTTLYRWLRSRDFPAPAMAPSDRKRYWRLSDVQAWSEATAAAEAAKIKQHQTSDSSASDE